MSSYSERDRKTLLDTYLSNPCLEVVDKLSVLLNRPRKSIISKLVKEGVYVTRGYVTKTGETPVTKLQILRTIEDALDTKLPGLDKAPKGTLKALCVSVVDQAILIEDALDELKGRAEITRVQDEIFEVLNNG